MCLLVLLILCKLDHAASCDDSEINLEVGLTNDQKAGAMCMLFM